MLVAACALRAGADVVHLITGEQITGKVVRYENMSFELTRADGIASKYPAAAVQRIDFDDRPAPARFETRNRGAFEAKLLRYESASFSLDNGHGQIEKLPAAFVTAARFGGEPARDIVLIARGARVDIARHLARGHVTIVDFYADWCGPCRMISPYLEKLAREDPDVVLRKVDIIRWGTPVTQQYNIVSIPRIEIYDRAGKLVGTVTGVSQKKVDEYVARAKLNKSGATP